MTVVQNMVLHGRRAGTPKEQKTAVLTSGDMDRIKSQLNRGKNEEAERLARLEEEQKRFEASKTRQSQWSNTLAGQRKAKLAAKKVRLNFINSKFTEYPFQPYLGPRRG